MLKKQLTYKPTVGDGLPNGRGREQGHQGAPALGPAEGELTPERTTGAKATGEGAGTSGRTSTGAGGGRADTRAHGGPGTRAAKEGARAPAAETLATVGRGTAAETLAIGGNGGVQGIRRTEGWRRIGRGTTRWM